MTVLCEGRTQSYGVNAGKHQQIKVRGMDVQKERTMEGSEL